MLSLRYPRGHGRTAAAKLLLDSHREVMVALVLGDRALRDVGDRAHTTDEATCTLPEREFNVCTLHTCRSNNGVDGASVLPSLDAVENTHIVILRNCSQDCISFLLIFASVPVTFRHRPVTRTRARLWTL